MGGVPPLGYDVDNRRLLVNEKEAKIVRHIFKRFVEVGYSTILVKELVLDGVTSKCSKINEGKEPLLSSPGQFGLSWGTLAIRLE